MQDLATILGWDVKTAVSGRSRALSRGLSRRLAVVRGTNFSRGVQHLAFWE